MKPFSPGLEADWMIGKLAKPLIATSKGPERQRPVDDALRKSKIMELIIIRHGLPLRIEKKDNTPADPGLSETGIHQAEKLAQWLKNEKIDAIYSSPMKRAKMAAQPLAELKRLEANIDPVLAEFDEKSFEYIPME